MIIQKKEHCLFLCLLTFLLAVKVNAQTGINTKSPNKDAALHVESTNKGVLIPRLSFGSTTTSSPLTAHVAGMLVYNTATAGSSPTEVKPGFYFNDGARWVKIADETVTDPTEDAWVNENGEIVLGSKSDGSTVRDDGTEFVIKDNGNVGIGTSAPTSILHTKGAIRLEDLADSDANGRVITADADGNLAAKALSTFYPKILIGGDASDAVTTVVTATASSGNKGTANIKDVTFSLAKKSVVYISADISFAVRENAEPESNVTTGYNNIIDIRAKFSGVPAGSPIATNKVVLYARTRFLSADDLGYAGFYTVNGKTSLVLEPGSYTLQLEGSVTVPEADTTGLKVKFGGGSFDRIDITSFPTL